MKQKGFAPILIILVIAILGVVGYFAYKNYNTNPPVLFASPFPSTVLVTPSPSPIPRDVSLENFLKNKYSACLEYFGENTCTPQNTKTVPPGYMNSDQLDVVVIQAISGNFALVGVGVGPHVLQKQDGSWKVVYVGGGGIPDCSEINMIPPGTFGDTLDACYDDGRKETILKSTGKPLVP